MQIVIDISKSDYEYIKRLDKTGIGECLIDNVYEGVRKGIVLPKGHGRLIDADAIDWFKGEDEEGNPCYILDKRDLNLEPTIIEADKESEDEHNV